MRDRITTPAEALEAAAHVAFAAMIRGNSANVAEEIREISARIAPPVMSVETVAAAIWRMGLGKLRPNNQWPDDVRGGSHDLFRQYARAAILAMGGAPDDAEDAE